MHGMIQGTFSAGRVPTCPCAKHTWGLDIHKVPALPGMRWEHSDLVCSQLNTSGYACR